MTAREVRSPRTSPSETSALVATSVAVSKARISIAVNRDKSLPFFVAMLELHLHPRSRKNTGSRLRPFDEDDGVVEIRLEVAPLRRRDTGEAKEVEMRHVDPPLVAMADRVRRARDSSLDSERTARTAYEGRLAGAELTRDGHDVARTQLRREPGGNLLRLFRRVRFDQNSPSCTAGSAATGAT